MKRVGVARQKNGGKNCTDKKVTESMTPARKPEPLVQ